MPEAESDSRDRGEGFARYQAAIEAELTRRQNVVVQALRELDLHSGTLAGIAEALVETLRAGGKVLVAGNGGSAAEAQHFSAELVGRFLRDRRPLAAIALTTDSSILTAVANDYCYEDVFARQVEAIGRPGDLLIAFSTSGYAQNLLRAVAAARERSMTAVAFTGNRPSPLEDAADLSVRAPAAETPIVQELHTAITHLLCGIAEEELTAPEQAGTGSK